MSAKQAPTPEQMRAADPARSVWVSANAGSGKTHVLVERLIRLLLDGAAPDAILCITYTKAAAAEMASRLFKRLTEWTALDDQALGESLSLMGANGADRALRNRARKLFTMALETPGGLKIQTIHAFCERLLHLFPVEAGLAPGFAVMDERQAQELERRAMDEVLAGAEADAALAESFGRLANQLNTDRFEELIRKYLQALRKSGLWDEDLGRDRFRHLLNAALGLAEGDTLAAAKQALNTIDRAVYAAHGKRLTGAGKNRFVDAEKILLEASIAEEPWEKLKKFFYKTDGDLRAEFVAKKAAETHAESVAFIKAEQLRLDQAFKRFNTNALVQANLDAFALAREIGHRIKAEKHRAGFVDFEDLIARTASLLADAGAREWVRFKLDQGLSHILLDESQDTGPDQWRIIDSLTEEFFAGQGRDMEKPRTLFVVGDAKQSIYSFQGADSEAYAAARNRYVANGWLAEERLELSFRSTNEVLLAVDEVFSATGPDGKLIRHHSAARTQDAGLVEVLPLVPAVDKPASDPWTIPTDRAPSNHQRRRLAREIAGRIKAWLDPAKPRKLSGKNRPVKAGDILLLFRNRNSFFRMMLAELRAAGIPVAGADRLTLSQSLVVQDILALLGWLLLPQDDHALACVLKSPLVPEPVTEEQLFHLAHGHKSGSLGERVSGPNGAVLHDLRRRAAEPAASLIARILGRSRKAIAARLGSEAIEASDALLDLALEHDRSQGPSLFSFLRWMEAGDSELKRELDEAGGAVRLMTIHGAKGLEAPIVFIAEASLPGGGSNTEIKLARVPGPHGAEIPLWTDTSFKPWNGDVDELIAREAQRQQAESLRLLYVAMTRAADELYICGAQHRDIEKSWWRPITDKLGSPKRYGADDQHLAPVEADGNKGGAADLPDWVLTAAPVEKPRRKASVSLMTRNLRHDPAAAARGRAIHRFLEELASMEAGQREAHGEAMAAAAGLTPDEALGLSRLVSSPELAPFFAGDSRAEADIFGLIADGREVSGRLDRLALGPDGLWLLDYKTDRHPPAATPASHDYARQMALYVALLRAAYPGQKITAALLWTQSQRLEILPEDLLTAALRISDDAAA